MRFLFRAVVFVVVGLVLLVLLGIPLGTWIYLHLNPARTTATVLDKTQSVYQQTGGGWKLNLRLSVRYQPSDSRFPEQTTIDADEETWDQSKPGTRVALAYVPVLALRQFPLVTTTRLAAPLPAVSRGPDERRTGTAVVRNIRRILRVGSSSRSRGMPAWQPFDVVEFDFVPEGRTEPVRAADSVDADSVPGLALGKPVEISYSTTHPRAARISAGSQAHEWKNNLELFGLPGVAALLFGAYALRKARH